MSKARDLGNFVSGTASKIDTAEIADNAVTTLPSPSTLSSGRARLAVQILDRLCLLQLQQPAPCRVDGSIIDTSILQGL